jgi:SAM-dependent methyltransferase
MVNFIEHNDYFTKIYSSGGWGPECPSGGGSTPKITIEYREFLENFLIENKIKSVYDFGCGDWSFSKLINWSNAKYTGVDVVKSVIDSNNANNEYSSENIKFSYLKDTEKFYRAKGDLLIIKDVLQHWTNEEITSFLDAVVNNFKFILITNSSPQQKDWQETPERNRPLSCKFYPLKKYNIKHLLNYGEKEISIIENQQL